MDTENKKYNMLMNMLRKSKPDIGDPEILSEKALNRIRDRKRKVISKEIIVDYLFGWIYIGWVRKSLVIASLIIVIVFVYQQSVILKKVNDLSEQIVVTGDETFAPSKNDLDMTLLLYKFSGHTIPSGNVNIPERQLEQLIESYNELKERYEDLLKLIEDDPELKEYIEKSLDNKNRESNL
jgi:hypothetical protein